jgi:hypothetical protein
MRLYDIAEQFEGLYSLLEEIETDENGVIIDNSDAVAELYNDIKGQLDVKLTNSAYLCKELAVNSKALKDEAKRLTEKAKVLENREKQIKFLMKTAINQSGETKIKTDKFSFNVRTSEVYNYDGVVMFGLDDEFIKRTETLDKTKVKQFIKAGGTVDGVKISEDTVLTVR